MKRSRLIAFLVLAFGILAGALILHPSLAGTLSGLAGQNDAEAVLKRALERARDAGSYQVDIALDQTVIQQQPLGFAPQEESAHFEIEGAIAGPDRARFSISPGRTTFALATRDPQEFLVVDATVYRRAGDRWVKAGADTPALEIDGLGLSLLSVARDVQRLEPAKGPPVLGALRPTFRRLGFKLYPEDIRRYLLAQQGISDPATMKMVAMSGPVIQGAGEIGRAHV